MFKIITWSIMAILMAILTIMDFSAGEIFAGVIAALTTLCDITLVGLSIDDYRRDKAFKKLEESNHINVNIGRK